MGFRNQPQKLEWDPRWFRVTLTSRKVTDVQEKHVAFTSGTDKDSVKEELQKANVGFIVKVKEISYDDIIKELNK